MPNRSVERRPLDDLRLQPADVDADAVRRRPSSCRRRRANDADDHLRRADELSDLDDRRAAERRATAAGAAARTRARARSRRWRRDAAGVQLVGQQHRRGLAQPVQAAARRGVFSNGTTSTRLRGRRRCGGAVRRDGRRRDAAAITASSSTRARSAGAQARIGCHVTRRPPDRRRVAPLSVDRQQAALARLPAARHSLTCASA